MSRLTALAGVFAAVLSTPVFAAETALDDATLTAVHAAELSNLAAAQQASRILAARGYVNVSITGRDEDGRWTGLAFKDGKTVLVAVELPRPQAPFTN